MVEDVRIADLNGDKYPELIFANEGNTDEEAGALIYWGGASGHHSERPAPTCLVTGRQL